MVLYCLLDEINGSTAGYPSLPLFQKTQNLGFTLKTTKDLPACAHFSREEDMVAGQDVVHMVRLF